MNKYPEYAEVNGKKYKINTDFRIAIRCNEIIEDESIQEIEKNLAIICILFGDEALDDENNYRGLLDVAIKFLYCNKKNEVDSNYQKDFDFIQDYEYIEASYMSDYRIDLSNTNMHWWKFMNLFNGLSNSEMGNCCVINRIRNLRNINLSEIKDLKERERIRKAKESVALKNIRKKKVEQTENQKNSAKEFYINLYRKE